MGCTSLLKERSASSRPQSVAESKFLAVERSRRVGGRIAGLCVPDGGPFPASAMAIGDAGNSPSFRVEIFNPIAWSDPEVALKVLAGGWRSVAGAWWGSLRSCRSLPFGRRLISALLKLAESEGKKTDRGIEFQLPASHQELANQLGTVRELVSRNLMRLQAEGLLDVDARQIVVKDLSGLKSLLETSS